MGGFLHYRGDWPGREAQRPSSLHIGRPCPQLTMEGLPEASGKGDEKVEQQLVMLQDENGRLSEQIKRLVRTEHDPVRPLSARFRAMCGTIVRSRDEHLLR